VRRAREPPKPNVEEKKVCQSAGSQASLAVVGRRVPSHESGFHQSSRGLFLQTIHLDAQV